MVFLVCLLVLLFVFYWILGNNGKEVRKEKELVSPTIHENANGENCWRVCNFGSSLVAFCFVF